jgi:uncharacterized protein (DUF58 family)
MNVGRVFIALLISAGIIGSFLSGADFYAHMILLGVLLTVGARLWISIVARSIRLNRQPDFWRASVGDIFKEQYEIVNTSRLRGGWVELYNEMPLPAVSGSRLLTRLQPREKQTYVARTWLTRRGGFPVGPTTLTISDPLGLFRIRRRFSAERSLVVLPMIFPVQEFMTPPGFLPGGQVIRRKTSDVTPHAAGVRSYVAGDPMKRIHWPTSARREQLMVKEFEQDPQAEVWIFLDAQASIQAQKAYVTPAMPLESLLFSRKPRLTLPPSTLEYEISVAASLAHYFIAQNRAVGFVAQDRAYAMIPPERSQRQETKIMETLAFIEGKGDMSISALCSAHARLMPRGASAILVTATTSAELLVATGDLLLRKLHPMVVLLDAESFDGKAGAAEIVRRLGDQQVPVLLLQCGVDLAAGLSSLAPSSLSQNVITWQRPTLSHLT